MPVRGPHRQTRTVFMSRESAARGSVTSSRVSATLAPMRRLRVSFAITVAGLIACGGGGNGATSLAAVTGAAATTMPGGSESSGSMAAGSSSTGTAAADGSASTSSSNSGTGDTLVLDMGMPDFGSPLPKGCQGKIDFMFVVSAAGTMKFQQQQLLDSFPGFMAAIEAQLPDFDVHIISADADAIWPLDDCNYCDGEYCDPLGTPPGCGAVLDQCDKKIIGAGVTFPAGEGASNRRCELFGGNRYIIDGEPNLTEAFTCIAQVGIDGGVRTAEAMVQALSPELNGPLKCNEGFLRDDALLVVTLIQDTYDEYSAGSVDSWIEALRTAKKGDDDAFAVLALTTDVDKGPWELCLPGTYNKTKNRLRLLVEGVEHGFIGSICEKTYDPFFAETVSAVVDLCDGFVPPPE